MTDELSGLRFKHDEEFEAADGTDRGDLNRDTTRRDWKLDTLVAVVNGRA